MKNDNRVNILFLVTLENAGSRPEIEVLNRDGLLCSVETRNSISICQMNLRVLGWTCGVIPA